MEHKTYYYSPGQIIFHQGDAGGFLYQVQSGSVEISCNYPHENAVVIGTAGPGDFFGEMALIDNRPRMATATATSKTICTKIWPDEVATILDIWIKCLKKTATTCCSLYGIIDLMTYQSHRELEGDQIRQRLKNSMVF
jgi:CRP/FNR family transcriptional regulator, cyclic AMP receptor protein